MVFSPIIASENIVKKYKRYLSTIFKIADKDYSMQFKSALNDPSTIAKGPYLDVTDSFAKGKSLHELVDEGLLSADFSKLGMPYDRPLYKHQELAVRKAQENKNLVVSTGTGSGKTECFLIPVLNELMREKEEGSLNDGVRALLIYPMNALANDQIERLRELLSDYPMITYGSYTGQTKQAYKDALAEYKLLNNQQAPKKNELISREQMKSAPPHILITNYAMLEYLMVRPDDNVFFSGEFAYHWRYIVLDEAHVYNGSTGIEVSMLLRRLKAKLTDAKIQYILTSATLGGENDNKEVAQFAKNLCDSQFDKSNIVRAYRIRPEIPKENICVPAEFYHTIAELINQNTADDKICKEIRKASFPCAQNGTTSELLYDILLHDQNYIRIKRLLEKPKTVAALCDEMGWSKQETGDFVTVATACEKNGDRLFDARYHMFLRASESVFITLKPSGKLFLTRKKEHIEKNGTSYKIFEIATCSYCHSIYLIGKETDGILEQSNFHDDSGLRSVYLLADSISDTDEDHLMEDESLNAQEYQICARCGFVRRKGSPKEHCCEHGTADLVKVYKVTIKNESGTLTKCPACENTSSTGVLRMFFTGQEAVTSVIGTALFEELPSTKITYEVEQESDDTGFGTSEDSVIEHRTKQAKQFIAFSDNRQAAAFYASYFDQTYRSILYKRLIIETLKDPYYNSKGKSIDCFVEDLIAQFEKYGVAAHGDSARKEAWKAILQEIVDNNGNTSLFSMGMIKFSVDSTDVPENTKYHLTADEVANLCNVFVLGMMSDAAVSYNIALNRAEKEYFTHNGVEYSYTLSDSDPKNFQRSFIPQHADLNNKRIDYLTRVLSQAGFEVKRQCANKMLEAIWKNILIRNGILKNDGDQYKVDLSQIMISRAQTWYVCPKCRKITPYFIRGVCPGYQCGGTLKKIDLETELADNHYFQLYRTMNIQELRVVEHTAQLDKKTAYDYQKKFKCKEIDVLSCSTTFEMGVDVGSLETVFMRNVPPSPANYAQRAGRAGRSRHSAAYALTFCNKSSHDFTYFKSPEKMIRGRIDPPKFIIENEKIAIRHLYASALSFFWKSNPEYFSKAANMAEESDEMPSGVNAFYEYLKSKPKDLLQYLQRFLPAVLADKFKVKDYGWVNGLISNDKDNPGVLTKAVAEYQYEVGILKEAKENAYKAGRKVDNLSERIRVYQNEEILSFLSRKNVLPKYGFPVDTVEMSIVDHSGKSKLGLELQRDLSIAISEYAPGSQIVANGNLITSRYIRKIPNMSWKMYDYIQCENCKTLNIEPHVDDVANAHLEVCRQCGEKFEPSAAKVFLVPAFGFEADGSSIKKPGLKKPERTYKGEIAYVGYRDKAESHKYTIGHSQIELDFSQGDEMAVINGSNFYVCESCGYTELDPKAYTRVKRKKHNNTAGYPCRNDGKNVLKRFSLGYRFQTDIVQIRFLNPDLNDFDTALSVLYGVLRGVCSCLNIEQSDVAGCVQYFYNDVTNRENYALIFYDKTPGGAGHVRRLNDEEILGCVFKETLSLMEQCNCGGDKMDTSCYACLRSYYNQKYHDQLKRGSVIRFMKELLD